MSTSLQIAFCCHELHRVRQGEDMWLDNIIFRHDISSYDSASAKQAVNTWVEKTTECICDFMKEFLQNPITLPVLVSFDKLRLLKELSNGITGTTYSVCPLRFRVKPMPTETAETTVTKEDQIICVYLLLLWSFISKCSFEIIMDLLTSRSMGGRKTDRLPQGEFESNAKTIWTWLVCFIKTVTTTAIAEKEDYHDQGDEAYLAFHLIRALSSSKNVYRFIGADPISLDTILGVQVDIMEQLPEIIKEKVTAIKNPNKVVLLTHAFMVHCPQMYAKMNPRVPRTNIQLEILLKTFKRLSHSPYADMENRVNIFNYIKSIDKSPNKNNSQPLTHGSLESNDEENMGGQTTNIDTQLQTSTSYNSFTPLPKEETPSLPSTTQSLPKTNTARKISSYLKSIEARNVRYQTTSSISVKKKVKTGTPKKRNVMTPNIIGMSESDLALSMGRIPRSPARVGRQNVGMNKKNLHPIMSQQQASKKKPKKV